MRKHKGVPLTLPQANHWARIYDATGNAAIAWSQFEKIYRIENGRWIKRANFNKELDDMIENPMQTIYGEMYDD